MNCDCKAAAISQIWALVTECSTANWDGYGGELLSEVAAAVAVEFVLALPEDVPLPEFAPDSDGSITLDWLPERGRFFGISVGTNHRLAYAWLSGTASGHGVAEFDGRAIPPEVLDFIKMAVEVS